MVTGLVLLAGDPGTLCRWDLHDDPGMPAELRWRVAAAQPCAVVRLIGVLDAAVADPARAALLTFLADQPVAVVVDLAEMTAPDPATLAVFGEAARESRRWPAGRLIISAPPAALADPHWGAAGLSVPGNLAETIALLVSENPGTGSCLELDPVVGAARQAREFTNDRCTQWGVTDIAESACIAVTEMVNNVVAHAGTPMALRLRPRSDGCLQLSVRDHSTVQPSFTGPAPPTSTGGRGLFLIDTVTREWGASRLADGKVVWALLRPEDESPG